MKFFNAVESAELKPQLSMSDENDERLIIIKCHDEKIVILYKKKFHFPNYFNIFTTKKMGDDYVVRKLWEKVFLEKKIPM